MKKILFGILLILGLVLLYLYITKDFLKTESEIFFNGEIITLDEETSEVEAIFVKDGIIHDVGKKEDILKLKSSNTVLSDLDGKTLMPGFIDPHTHPALSVFLHNMVDLSGFTHSSKEELWQHLTKSIQKTSRNEWIICKGFDPILIPGLTSPHISFLDELAPENPLIIISQSLHSYWANSIAFNAVGVTNNTPDPSVSSFYEKDERGELTGFIAEQEAFRVFQDAILNSVEKSVFIQSTLEVLKDYARRGNTSIVSAGLTIKEKNALMLFEHLAQQKPGFINQFLSKLNILPSREALPRHFIYLRYDTPHLMPNSPSNGDDHFRILGVKYWYDGSPYTGSMYLSEPYLESPLTIDGFRIEPGYSGKRLIDPGALKKSIKDHHLAGWQISIHTQGDQAIAETIESFSSLQNELDFSESRHRLEHCLLLAETYFPQLNTLNITPSLHINHLYYYGQALKEDIIGEERSSKILPAKSLIEHQINISLHADQPMFESNPFRLIQTAVLRKTKEGEEINPGEGLSILQGLKAMTIDAAWQIHMEDKIGSIKEGKYADLIILDRNPLKTAPEELEEIQVMETIVHGNRIAFK